MDTQSESQVRHVLILNTGDRRAFALEAAAYSIGRDFSNAIVLDFDTISRQHALLLRVPTPKNNRYEYRIIDGNAEGKPSANGVFINGQAIKSQTLKNGDTVEFGKHVRAAYLTLSMGEAEFVTYLESISYQSLKTELVDSKATMVGAGFDEMFLDTPTTITPATVMTSEPKAKVANKHHAEHNWLVTLHDSEKVDQELAEVKNSHRGKGTNSAQSANSPMRLWMMIVAGTLTLASVAVGLFFMFQNQSSKVKTSPELSSQNSSQNVLKK